MTSLCCGKYLKVLCLSSGQMIQNLKWCCTLGLGLAHYTASPVFQHMPVRLQRGVGNTVLLSAKEEGRTHPGECLTVFTHGCPFAMPKGDHSSALSLTQGASSTSFLRKRLGQPRMLQMDKTSSFALRCVLIVMAVQMSEILENFQSALCLVNTKNH